MYMTRLPLDSKNRQTMLALAEPKRIHGAIERSFNGTRKRNLWRIDRLNGMDYLLLVSPEKPDMTEAAKQFAPPGATWETREYGPLLQRVHEGTRWHFRLTANPVYHSAGNATTGERGKVLPHVTPTRQKEWLMKKAEANGFSLNEDEFQVVETQSIRFRKPDGQSGSVTLQAVTYEGRLQVTDAALFCHALTEGIGRGKAYGMGLLTVMGIGEGR